ncbi:hypothetical protein A6770_05600 [Nostoc minutum NIES-26]|uniref:Uncharacterized protein n=1 Tax=Nostoc minutum NIES-26 TaxID=1844469 RepID=A0A367Q633_9NOSO|nr:hypothetical protein A6770_05600 [Nostoc minutum NIES-26]
MWADYPLFDYLVALNIIAANNGIKPKSDQEFRFPLVMNTKSLAGVATAFPDDSSFDSQELAGIGFGLEFDGCR